MAEFHRADVHRIIAMLGQIRLVWSKDRWRAKQPIEDVLRAAVRGDCQLWLVVEQEPKSTCLKQYFKNHPEGYLCGLVVTVRFPDRIVAQIACRRGLASGRDGASVGCWAQLAMNGLTRFAGEKTLEVYLREGWKRFFQRAGQPRAQLFQDQGILCISERKPPIPARARKFRKIFSRQRKPWRFKQWQKKAYAVEA